MSNTIRISDRRSENINIGIFGLGPGWGDAIICSALPENYYLNTGFKIVDLNKHFVYDYNPFVLRNVEMPRYIFEALYLQNLGSTKCNQRKKQWLSMQEKLNESLDLPNTFLRHSRLYKYEDSPTILNKVTIHTQGKTIGGRMSEKVMNLIREKYKKNYELFQVGGKDDIKFEDSHDLRGLSFWDTCKHISESAIFIGIDSACIHIADSYRKVRTKYLIMYLSEENLKTYSPMRGDCVWWDYGRESYNIYDYDIGATMSYLKI